MKGLLSTSVRSFQSAPSRLEISELCILGFSCAIFLRWPRDQTMKAFIGLLMWSICLEPGPMVHWADNDRAPVCLLYCLLDKVLRRRRNVNWVPASWQSFGRIPVLRTHSSPAQAWPKSRRRARTQHPVWALIGRPSSWARRWLAERPGEMVRVIIGGCNSIKISRLKVMFQMFRSLHLHILCSHRVHFVFTQAHNTGSQFKHPSSQIRSANIK